MGSVELWIQDKKAARPLANPLYQASIIGALLQGIDSIQGIGAAAAGRGVGRLGPLVDHRQGQPKLGGDLFGAAPLENLSQYFIRMHKRNIEKEQRAWQGGNLPLAGSVRAAMDQGS